MKITLAAARVNAGYKQDDASQLLGISKQTLINYEKGYTSITLEVLQKMVSLYRVELENIALPKRKKRNK